MNKNEEDEKKKDIGIYDLTKAVRNEILRIKKDEKIQKNVIMQLDEVDLELNVSITKVGEAGINFHILSLGGKIENQVTDTIRLVFKPPKGSDTITPAFHREKK